MDERMLWENLSIAERDALVARVLGTGPRPSPDDLPPPDAAVTIRLIEHLAAERRATALRVSFALWPDAWSLFVETTIAGAGEEIHVVGDTLYDCVAKSVLTLHDVDVDLLYVDGDGTPSEQRAIQALRQPVSRILGWALVADMDRDLLTTYRRLGDVTGLTRDTIAALLARELHHRISTVQASGDMSASVKEDRSVTDTSSHSR